MYKYLKYSLLFFIMAGVACSNQAVFTYEPVKNDGEEKLLSFKPPVYSDDLMAQGIEGYVIVKFSINEKGEVDSAEIVEEYPAKIFSQAAIISVKTSVYQPKSVNGVPTRVDNKYRRVTFFLNGEGINAVPKLLRNCENTAPEFAKGKLCKRVQ